EVQLLQQKCCAVDVVTLAEVELAKDRRRVLGLQFTGDLCRIAGEELVDPRVAIAELLWIRAPVGSRDQGAEVGRAGGGGAGRRPSSTQHPAGGAGEKGGREFRVAHTDGLQRTASGRGG